MWPGWACARQLTTTWDRKPTGCSGSWESALRGTHITLCTGVRKQKGNGHQTVKRNGKSVKSLPSKARWTGCDNCCTTWSPNYKCRTYRNLYILEEPQKPAHNSSLPFGLCSSKEQIPVAGFEALFALIIEMKLSKLFKAAAGIYFSKAMNPEEWPLLGISCSHF